jgi:hypothetical protein
MTQPVRLVRLGPGGERGMVTKVPFPSPLSSLAAGFAPV